MNSKSLDETRDKILEVLAMLDREHRKNCEPWIQKLAEIEAIRNPDICIVSIDEFRRGFYR